MTFDSSTTPKLDVVKAGTEPAAPVDVPLLLEQLSRTAANQSESVELSQPIGGNGHAAACPTILDLAYAEPLVRSFVDGISEQSPHRGSELPPLPPDPIEQNRINEFLRGKYDHGGHAEPSSPAPLAAAELVKQIERPASLFSRAVSSARMIGTAIVDHFRRRHCAAGDVDNWRDRPLGEFFLRWFLPVVLFPEIAHRQSIADYAEAVGLFGAIVGNARIERIDETSVRSFQRGLLHAVHRSGPACWRPLTADERAEHVRRIRTLLQSCPR